MREPIQGGKPHKFSHSKQAAPFILSSGEFIHPNATSPFIQTVGTFLNDTSRIDDFIALRLAAEEELLKTYPGNVSRV